jgi:predicted metal-dependent hydrolase
MKQATIALPDRSLTIGVLVSRRARRIALRVDERNGEVRLVLPRFVSQAEGLAFARQKAPWIVRQIAALPPRVPFAPGALVPYLGRLRRIRHDATGRGTVLVEDGEIVVAGEERFLARRLTDWLRRTARRTLAERATRLACRLDKRVTSVRIRDTRSRWASCSSDGLMSFSWRLMLAPEDVIDYVVAHEVAHLVELNHGPRFWRLVSDLCPDHRTARRWLKDNGTALHRFG